jgi:hypothetical protein
MIAEFFGRAVYWAMWPFIRLFEFAFQVFTVTLRVIEEREIR